MRRLNRAQSLIEYALVIGVITVALLSMQVYFRRGLQSVARVAADDFGPQGEAVNDVEMAAKQQMYSEEYAKDKPKRAVNAQVTSVSATKKTNLTGDSNIRTETSSSNTVTGAEPSYSISGDYKHRKID